MSNWKRQPLDALRLAWHCIVTAVIIYTLAFTCVAMERLIPGFTPRLPF